MTEPLSHRSAQDEIQLDLSKLVARLQGLKRNSLCHEVADLYRAYLRQADDAVSEANSGR